MLCQLVLEQVDLFDSIPEMFLVSFFMLMFIFIINMNFEF